MNTWTLTIGFESGCTVGSGFGFAGIVDHTTVRDAEGRVYLPASSIKGKLRSQCRRIARSLNIENPREYPEYARICREDDLCTVDHPCVLCELFGSPVHPGSLYFSDGRLVEEDRRAVEVIEGKGKGPGFFETQVRTHVKIGRSRRVAEDQHLFSVEEVNRNLQFETKVEGVDGLGESAKQLLQWGIESLTHLGGHRSRGRGRCTITLNEGGTP